MAKLAEAVRYDLWFTAKDATAPIQTKCMRVQAITDAEATELGQGIAEVLGCYDLIRVERKEWEETWGT